MRTLCSRFDVRFALAALSFVAAVSMAAPLPVAAQPLSEHPREFRRLDTSLAPVESAIRANPVEETVVRPGADPRLPGLPDTLAVLIEDGEFSEAIRRLEAMRANADRPGSPLPPRALEWQIEKLRRYMADYTVTREQLHETLQRRVRDYEEPELDMWIREGLVDRMRIDGEERFVGPTVSNLFFLSSRIRHRRIGGGERRLERFVAETVEYLGKEARESGESLIKPLRWRAAMSLWTETAPERAGQTLRCWMPFPRSFPFLQNIEILESDPAPAHIAPADALQRTVFFQQPAKADGTTSFGIVYEFTAHSRVNVIEDFRADAIDPNSPEARAWTHEEAHIRFTPELRALYEEIAEGDRNPARLARRFYLWICNNIRYSYAREYSSLDDIAWYTAARRAGDCGQEALLFIALCRMAGIPARWQSGWTVYPDWTGIHDWAEIHIPPYGWVPVDPYMGIWATRYIETLPETQRRAIRDFYFGSMDAYRLPANAAHSAPFDPPKVGFRSDDVDNQRGEMEWYDGTNLYFGQYRRKMTITNVPLK